MVAVEKTVDKSAGNAGKIILLVGIVFVLLSALVGCSVRSRTPHNTESSGKAHHIMLGVRGRRLKPLSQTR